MKQCPKRGDIIIVDLNPTIGHEQSGLRPAVVLSFDIFNERIGLAFIAPITSKIKGNPFEVSIDSAKTSGVALAHHVRMIDFVARKAKIVDKVSHDTIVKIISKVEPTYVDRSVF